MCHGHTFIACDLFACFTLGEVHLPAGQSLSEASFIRVQPHPAQGPTQAALQPTRFMLPCGPERVSTGLACRSGTAGAWG